MSDRLNHDLHELLGALADRADGITPASATQLIRRARRRVKRRRVAATATGALVAAAAIVVAVVVSRTHDSPTRIELLPGELSMPDFSTTIVTTGPTVAVNDGTGPVVDVADPPPLFTPRPFASIEMVSAGSPNGRRAIAVTPQGAVLVDRDTKQALVVHEATGTVDRVALEVATSETVVADGVLYGLVWGEEFSPTLQMVAVPLSGPRAGQVVSTAPLDPNAYTENPIGRFGQGADGIIDRATSKAVMAYVNADGTQSTLTPSIGELSRTDDTITSSSGSVWPLDIRRHADAATPFEGESRPAWTSDGDAVVWTSIGPRSDPGSDFGTPTMPVIATLRPDTSVRWMRIPDDWYVASSDMSGVILARETTGKIELARFSDLT